MQQLFSLANKVIIITGATGVLGESFVKALAKANAKVVLLGRNEVVGKQREKEILGENCEAIFIKADVLNEDDLKNVLDIVLKKWNKIDGLVNAAGGNIPEAVVQPNDDIFNLNINAFKKVFDLNLFGTMLPVNVFGKEMQRSGNASVVNISSMAAQKVLTKVLGYSLAKAAVDNYTKWMSVEAANRYKDSIRFNAIAPGFFITTQNKTLLTNEDGSFTDRGSNVIRNTPYKRFGQADELVGTLIWLLSDASKFVTGEVICVDGGFNVFSGV